MVVIVGRVGKDAVIDFGTYNTLNLLQVLLVCVVLLLLFVGQTVQTHILTDA